MEALKTWWADASPRDQMSVLVLGVFLLIYIAFNYVLMPVVEMKDKQVNRVEAQSAAYERVKNLAAQVKSKNEGNASGPSKSSIEKIVERSFSQHGLRVTGFDASGRSGIRVRFEQAEYSKLLAWMHDMEIAQGLRFKDVSVANSNNPGKVTASILIQKN